MYVWSLLESLYFMFQVAATPHMTYRAPCLQGFNRSVLDMCALQHGAFLCPLLGEGEGEGETFVHAELTQWHFFFLQFEVELLRSDVKELKRALYEENDFPVTYTGLSNWEIFLVLYDYIKNDLSSCLSLSPFSQLLCDLYEAKT